MNINNLRKYQIDIASKMIDKQRAMLWIGMGYGKTITTLTALSELHMLGLIKRVLIVAPLSVARTVWHVEAKQWEHTQHFKFALVLGSELDRKFALTKNADIDIINFENIQWLVEHKANKKVWDYDCVVIDEISCLKDWQGKRFKSLKTCVHISKYFFGLTGTPLPRAPENLLSQFYLLDAGKVLGKSLTDFREKYSKKETTQYVGNGITTKLYEYDIDKIKDDVKPLVLSVNERIDIPNVLYQNEFIVLPKSIYKACNELKRLYYNKLESEGATVTASNGAVVSGKIKQIMGGACYTGNDANVALGLVAGKEVARYHDAKINRLMEILDVLDGKPVIVFYQYKHEKDRILTMLNHDAKIVRVFNTSLVDEWNAGKIPVLLAHPANMAHGLNLQRGGNNIIWYSLPYSLELYQQANARLARSGQKSVVTVQHLLDLQEFKNGNTASYFDLNILDVLQGRSTMQAFLMDIFKDAKQTIDTSDLNEFFDNIDIDIDIDID